MSEEDDDFQNPSQAFTLTQKLILSSCKNSSNSYAKRPAKKAKSETIGNKENVESGKKKRNIAAPKVEVTPLHDRNSRAFMGNLDSKEERNDLKSASERVVSVNSNCNKGYEDYGYGMGKIRVSMSIESRLLGLGDSKKVSSDYGFEFRSVNGFKCVGDGRARDFEHSSQLDALMNLCADSNTVGNGCSSGLAEKEVNLGVEGKDTEVLVRQMGLLGNGGCPRLNEKEVNLGGEGEINEFLGRGRSLLQNDGSSGLAEKEVNLGDEGEISDVLLRDTSVLENGGCSGLSEKENKLGDEGENTKILERERAAERLGEGIETGGVGFHQFAQVVECPLCGIDITYLSEEDRLVHSNGCLDKDEIPKANHLKDEMRVDRLHGVADVTPVLNWLRTLNLSRYEEAFIKEEIDWDTLQWLKEEDLINLGINALGPRRKILHALNELRKQNMQPSEVQTDHSSIAINDNGKLVVPGNKLITEFFQGSSTAAGFQGSRASGSRPRQETALGSKGSRIRNPVSATNVRDIPPWSCIPGTPFRVDAFRYLRGDCSHWFLTHFHLDHYQGLTRGFRHGKIYCSEVTARLINMKIGITLDKIQVLPLNCKINIAGVNVTCFDANHCPGSIMILFEPSNGRAVLHTGDFRFCTEMGTNSILRSCSIHTLILDTTYCDAQYDFPKQEAVVQFVIEAIQAEAFNPKTLFLIGSYTIGKEKLFLEVARFLRKKVYVGVAKLRLLQCLGLAKEDMQWFTSNEHESHIHVVPMWTIASFKRMKYLSNQYSGRYNLIVAFSPTGWTFGKGKKKSNGRRWQQGTIIRYEVPYSEHCSFTELREFVSLVSPVNIIPSVNNSDPQAADVMVSLLSTSNQL
ncbi:uncharacterized protein LOC18433777 isoform X1 [Amborella trichopoda]|uniref:SAM domain-containing protein n=1 Tax=Amborella trichopoda TaxID=13333 RepID=W1PEU8_AMBTC|nr:uncharacterized protein LOC18433777 isoform X1 [Amborella trichopoda]ERN05595.1 hypothetical protein AMTR_s00007p00269400 [Amborella trichopoda]|eukprot:XP_020522534.1 uncharacterized protein LOC18433777 isoform X1 [Amborella trichopoda]